jgi:hypothetical protein
MKRGATVEPGGVRPACEEVDDKHGGKYSRASDNDTSRAQRSHDRDLQRQLERLQTENLFYKNENRDLTEKLESTNTRFKKYKIDAKATMKHQSERLEEYRGVSQQSAAAEVAVNCANECFALNDVQARGEGLKYNQTNLAKLGEYRHKDFLEELSVYLPILSSFFSVLFETMYSLKQKVGYSAAKVAVLKQRMLHTQANSISWVLQQGLGYFQWGYAALCQFSVRPLAKSKTVTTIGGFSMPGSFGPGPLVKRQKDFVKLVIERGVNLEVQGDNLIGLCDNIPTPDNPRYKSLTSRSDDSVKTVGVSAAIGFMHTYQPDGGKLLQLTPRLSPKNDRTYTGQEVHKRLTQPIFCDKMSEEEYFNNEIDAYLMMTVARCQESIRDGTNVFCNRPPADSAGAAKQWTAADFPGWKYCPGCDLPHSPFKQKCECTVGKSVKAGCGMALPSMAEYLKVLKEKKTGVKSGTTVFPEVKPRVSFGSASVIPGGSAAAGATGGHVTTATATSTATSPATKSDIPTATARQGEAPSASYSVIKVAGTEVGWSAFEDIDAIPDRERDDQQFVYETHVTVDENPNNKASIQRVLDILGQLMQLPVFVKEPKRYWAYFSADLGVAACIFNLLDENRLSSKYASLRYQMPTGHEEWSQLKSFLLRLKVG